MKAKAGFLFGAFVLVFTLLISQSFRLKTPIEIPQEFKAELQNLGAKALETKDVPVAAILVYKGKIVGRGYNTVLRNQQLAEHAEINAMTDAFSFTDLAFDDFNRDSLVLYSTFEPCEMCKGAMLQFQIKHVYFQREKSFFSGIKRTVKSWWFDAQKRRFNAPELQEKLFLQHPSYPNKK